MSGLARRLPLAGGAAAAALIVGTVTVWFLGYALFLLLGEKAFAPSAAAALTGVAGLALAGLIGFGARRALRPRPAPGAAVPVPGAASTGVNGIAVDLGALIAQQLVASARAHPYGTMGTALAAGLAVGAFPELRKALGDLLGR